MSRCIMNRRNTHTNRKARRILRSVARIMRRIGDHALGTKYQRLAGQFHD